MVQQPVTKDRARRSRRTGLRNTAAIQVISLRRITKIDASFNQDRRAGWATSRRRRSSSCRRSGWCWAGATTAGGAMIYIREVLEGWSLNAAYTPDVSVSIEASLVRLANRQWHVRI